MPNEQQSYQIEYNAFMTLYNKGAATGEQVGEVIAKMAQYFSEANLNFAAASVASNKKAAEIERGVDDSGKAISSAKAAVYAAATDEYAVYAVAKAHVTNIEQCINALKALQKGVLNEFSHMGSI